jgi:hypothetical protein
MGEAWSVLQVDGKSALPAQQCPRAAESISWGFWRNRKDKLQDLPRRLPSPATPPSTDIIQLVNVAGLVPNNTT